MFEEDGWPEGMGSRLENMLEGAFSEHVDQRGGDVDDMVSNWLGETYRELQKLTHPKWNHATSAATM